MFECGGVEIMRGDGGGGTLDVLVAWIAGRSFPSK